MAHLREETLNTYLALLLDSYEGITATAERRSSTEAIDITIVHGTAVAPIPILVEAKIGNTPSKRREAARQARSRLAAAPRSLAFGLCYPIHLRDGAVSAQATQNALAGSTVAFAPVQRFGREPTWREGSVADLADSLRNTDLSRQLVADTIEYTVHKAADMLPTIMVRKNTRRLSNKIPRRVSMWVTFPDSLEPTPKPLRSMLG